ncbi:MAG: hypothetical protein HUJ63_13380 [Enterococcus sp.]|nr:hypothetical protein [Enterococcus sp.]
MKFYKCLDADFASDLAHEIWARLGKTSYIYTDGIDLYLTTVDFDERDRKRLLLSYVCTLYPC